jgi:WD40 repeat protein
MAFNFLKNLDADDIFISYTRLDASTYAAGLADELTKRGFSCFIDKLGTDPDQDLPASLKRKIRSCSMFVVVGTERAAGREIIEQEIGEYLSTGRKSIVPVNFGDAVYRARWYPLVEGIAPEPELNPNALDDGNPSPSVVSRIEKQFNYRRRDERLRRITRRAVAVLAFLVIAIATAAVLAGVMFRRAAAASAKADAETARAAQATRDVQAAQDAARVAKGEADAARDEATTQRDEATKQKGLADKATQTATEKTRLANEATNKAQEATARANAEQERAERQAAIADIRAGANRSQNYLRQRPDEVPVSLSLALDVVKKAERIGIRSAEADAALRESLALLPQRRSRVRLAIPTDVAFSPDGLHYATITSEVLRIYAVGDADADGATPLLERPCKCTAVALDSGHAHAAAVLADGRGFRIFDLKDDSRSRTFKSVRGARGEAITSAEELALSPGGRYLAFYTEEDEPLTPNRLVVMDAAGGEPIRVYDNNATVDGYPKDIAFGPTGTLNMFIHDIAFGPTGDLAIVGDRKYISESRAVIWRLHADAPVSGAQSRLTADSFDRYEIVPQELYASAVAPGADELYLATNSGVWKRRPLETRFDSVARIPFPTNIRNVRFSSVYRIAFRPGGRSVVLARSTTFDSGEGDEIEELTVEVWDAAGYRSEAEAFQPDGVIHIGFEPGGRFVAATTGQALEDLTGEPRGAHRLHVYRTNNGVEVPSPEPDVDDRSAFYVGPDAAQLVTVKGDVVRVWDVWAKDEAKRKRTAAFGGALDGLIAVALGPGGLSLALAGPSGGANRVVVYRSDGVEYAEVRRFKFGELELKQSGGMALSADGRRLAVLDMDENTVHVFDDGVENEAFRQRFDGFGPIGQIALSADGRYLVVASQYLQGAVTRLKARTRLLDTHEGRWETLLDGAYVNAVAFSPDGAYVGLGTDEGVLHVFETAGREEGGAKPDARSPKEEIARLRHAGEVTAVAFSDDGRYVATASNQSPRYSAGAEGSFPLRVWLLRPADLIAESERRLAGVAPPER